MTKCYFRAIMLFAVAMLNQACTQKSNAQEGEHHLSTVEAPQKDSLAETPNIEINQTIITEGEEEDYTPTVYPKSFVFTTRLMQTGIFHGDEVPRDVNSREWIGLLKSEDDVYSLASILPITSSVFDVVLDVEGEKTGIEVSLEGDTNCLFMVDGTLLNINPLINAIELPSVIYPGEKEEFSFNGTDYVLSAKGKKTKLDETEDEEGVKRVFYSIQKYSLQLQIKGQKEVITLLDIKSIEEAEPKILFSGDLNGDGIIDFLIDTTYNYNMSRPTLYLSGKKGDKVVLTPVASQTTLGC